MLKEKLTVVFFAFLLLNAGTLSAESGVPESSVSGAPVVFRNGIPADVTAQDLSGFTSRPLRLLVGRNNRNHGEAFIQVLALGVSDGDELAVELKAPVSGVRATVYRIFREEENGPRYLAMPLSVYLPDASVAKVFQERVDSWGEEFLIFVLEKTDSPDEKEVQVRYFEERVRKLVIASFKTNLFFSSLKLKMKDLSEGDVGKFFERDAQLLVDRMIHPQKIVILRLWKVQK